MKKTIVNWIVIIVIFFFIDETLTFSNESPTNIFHGDKVRSFVGWGSIQNDFVASEPYRPHLTCRKWGVVTATFDLSRAVREFFELQVLKHGWCLVMVGDRNAPLPEAPYHNLRSDRAFFLNAEAQTRLADSFPFVKILPWYHFARKNVGYLFAMANGAAYIWDFDAHHSLLQPDLSLLDQINALSVVEPFSSLNASAAAPHAPPLNPYSFFGPLVDDAPTTNGSDSPAHACAEDAASSLPVPALVQPRGLAGVALLPADPAPHTRPWPAQRPLVSDSNAAVTVVQSLVTHHPDVDARYWIRHPQPLRWQRANTALVPPAGAVLPTSAQATLHTRASFWGLMLPLSVSSSVSDIWRGYFAAPVMAQLGLSVAYTSPLVARYRNATDSENDHPQHDDAPGLCKDLAAESQLYQQGPQLHAYLSALDVRTLLPRASDFNVEAALIALYIDLYERGFIEEVDVHSIRLWFQTLRLIGYDCSTIQFPAGPALSGEASHPATGNEEIHLNAVSERLLDLHHTVSAKVQSDAFMVIGILTVDADQDLRQAQRSTWLSFDNQPFAYRFLFEQPSEVSLQEQQRYGDVVFLNTPSSDRAVGLGEKLALWLRYAEEHFPQVQLIGKADDGVVICPALLDRLRTLAAPDLYYGWCHNVGLKPIGSDVRNDEMFVILGRDLVQAINRKAICPLHAPCDPATQLPDTGYGGTSLGLWLANLNQPINHVADNAVLHNGLQIPDDQPFPYDCDGVALLFHRVTPAQMQLIFRSALEKKNDLPPALTLPPALPCPAITDTLLLSININHAQDLPTVAPIIDAVYAHYFPHRIFQVEDTGETRQWAHEHPEIKVDFVHNREGWKQHLSIINSMQHARADKFRGFLHTNDEVLLNIGALCRMDPDRFWVEECNANRVAHPPCSPAAWALEDCPNIDPWWHPNHGGMKIDYQRTAFDLMSEKERSNLAFNMRHYPFSNFSLCGTTSDFAYIPNKHHSSYLAVANKLQDVIEKFAIFLPTVPRLLQRDKEFSFFTTNYLWGSDRSKDVTQLIHQMVKTGSLLIHPVKPSQFSPQQLQEFLALTLASPLLTTS